MPALPPPPLLKIDLDQDPDNLGVPKIPNAEVPKAEVPKTEVPKISVPNPSSPSSGSGQTGPVKGTPWYEHWEESYRRTHPEQTKPSGAEPSSGASPGQPPTEVGSPRTEVPPVSGGSPVPAAPSEGVPAKQSFPYAESVDPEAVKVKTQVDNWSNWEAQARGMKNDDKFKLQFAVHVHDKVNELGGKLARQINSIPDIAQRMAAVEKLKEQPLWQKQKELTDKWSQLNQAYPNIISQMPKSTDPQRKEKEAKIMEGFKPMPGEDLRKSINAMMQVYKQAHRNWSAIRKSGQADR